MAGWARQTGTVVFYGDVYGFGFVRPDDGSPDVYLPAKSLERSGLATIADGTACVFFRVEGYRDGRPFVVHLRPVKVPRQGEITYQG